MTKLTIELPDTFGIRRGGGTCVVKWADIPPAIIGELLQMAVTNKVGDAASGVKSALGEPFHVDGKAVKDDELTKDQLATMADKASEMMQAVLDTLEAGVWTQKRESASDPLSRIRSYIRRIVRKAKLDGVVIKDSDTYKAFDDADKRNAYLDSIFADTLSDKMRDAVIAKAESLWEKDNESLDLGDGPDLDS
jgi:hypothetical protein